MAPTAETLEQVKLLKRRTAPPTSSLQRSSAVTRNGESSEATWEFQTSAPTWEYFNSVKERLTPEYRVLSETKSELTMSKTLPGDTYTLDFKGSDTSSDAHITVHFVAMAD